MPKINLRNKEKKGIPARKKKKKSPYFGWQLTAGLVIFLVLAVSVIWSLFISGPQRLYEAKQEEVLAAIREQVPAVQGMEENVFEYVTYQGYTTDTLYWFDQTGTIITTRGLETLDYNKARQTAQDQYGIEPVSVELAFGYTSPVYEIQGEDSLLMLDYDSLEKVYER